MKNISSKHGSLEQILLVNIFLDFILVNNDILTFCPNERKCWNKNIFLDFILTSDDVTRLCASGRKCFWDLSWEINIFHTLCQWATILINFVLMVENILNFVLMCDDFPEHYTKNFVLSNICIEKISSQISSRINRINCKTLSTRQNFDRTTWQNK